MLHPLWVGALVVLVLNDHWFKGTGWAPALSGKLSDFAGLIVAPYLFATVVRARGAVALALCHGAVGLVFAALQLSPDAGAIWGQVMARVGVGWVTVSDPTDLLALPTLAVSWVVLGRATTAPRGAGRWWPRWLRSVCCAAWARPPPTPSARATSGARRTASTA